jgi:excisionase family DNA binding protein
MHRQVSLCNEEVRAMSDDTIRDVFNTDEAARYLRVSRSHLARLRVHGGGPRYAKLGPKLVVYRREDLEAYLALRLRDSTSEDG